MIFGGGGDLLREEKAGILSVSMPTKELKVLREGKHLNKPDVSSSVSVYKRVQWDPETPAWLFPVLVNLLKNQASSHV